MKFGVGIPLHVFCPPERFFDSVERVGDALIDLEACSPELLDSTFSANLDDLSVLVEVSVEAKTVGGALDLAVSFIRTAIHAAGDRTPGWESRPPIINGDLTTREITAV